MNSKKGFTLVELLGVLVVLGLISVIIVPKVIDSITTSKEAAYQTQVETIENAAKKYGISNDLLYPKEGEKKYIAVKDLIAVGELSDKEIINPKTGNKMNGYVLVEYNSGYQQYEYTYVEEIDENTLGAMGPTYEVKDPTKWTTSKNVTIIYPKGNGKYEYEFTFKGIVEIGGHEYNYTEQDWKEKWISTPELRKNITFKTNGSLIARVKNKDEYIYGSTLEIEKIDNTAPSAALGHDKNTLTTNKINLVATCTDNESGISKYLFKLGNGNWIDNGTSNKYTFSNLNDSTSYDFSVECINGVGMTSQSTLNSTTSEIGAPTFIVSNPGKWETNKNVTISYPENYTRYEFSIIDGTATRNGQELTPGTWYIASSLKEVVNFTTEGTIVARVYDGTNLKYAVNQAITYVDPTKPTCEILLTGGTLGTNGYYTVAPKVQFKTSIAGGSGIYFGQSKTNSPVYDNSVTKNNFGLINITDVNSDGNNTYYGFVKTGVIDKNVTSTCSKTFKVDTTKPVVAINGNASVSYANSAATITIPLKVTDLTSGIDTNTFTDSDITVKVGTTTVTPTKSLKYNSVSNGVYSYTLTLSGVTGNGALNLSVGAGMVVDKAGNKNNTASISTNVIIDNTAPTLEITGTNGTTYKKESNATITLKDTGGSGLTAGSYTIKYGWATSSQSCSNLTSSTTITVAAGATSGSVKVNVKGKTGAGKLYVCNSTSITDRAKNTLSANSIVSSNMYLDNQGPILSDITKSIKQLDSSEYKSAGLDDWTNGYTKLEWNVTEGNSGINRIEYRLNNQTTWSTGGGFTITKNGSTTKYVMERNAQRNDVIYIRVVDNMGNVSEVKSSTLKIDTTKPTWNSGITKYNKNTSSAAYTLAGSDDWSLYATKLEWSFNESISGINRIEYRLNDATTWTTSGGFTTSQDGNIYKYIMERTNKRNDLLYLRAVDNAGNVSEEKSIRLRIAYSATIPTNSLCVARTYNGSNQQITSATSGTGYTLSGYTQKNAGTHTITATLASGYRWSNNTDGIKTFECSISKATPTITLSATNGSVVKGKTLQFNATVKSGASTNVAGTLKAVSGTTSVATVSPASTSLTSVDNTNGKATTETVTGVSAGESTITVSFTPTDTANFNSAANKTYKAIILNSATIPTNSLCVARTYNGSDQQITSATSGTGYTLSGYTQKNAGTYTITATLASGYRWSDNTTGTKTFSCSISKAPSTIPTITAYEGIYDAASHTFTMSGGSGGTINYSTNNGTTWTTTKPTRTTAGTTTVQVKIVGDKNHNDTSVVSTTIKIDKRAITVKAAVAEKIYDGTALTKTDGCESSTNLVSGHEAKCTNTGALLNAGSSGNTLSKVSVVSATGADVTDNYEITKEGGRLTVKPKSVAVTWGSTTTFTYNGNAQAPTASVATGISNETMTVTRTTGTNAGSYTSTASCSSVTGGQAKCSNYTLTGNKKAFTISTKATTITAASASKTYDGTALTKISGCASSTNLATGHTATCTNSGTITNAGSATNTLSTVVIKDASGTDVTKNYAITKANGKLTVNKKSVAVTWGSTTTFTYNGSSHGPSLSSTSLTGANSETVYLAITSGAQATSAGTYTAKATCVHVSKGQETKSCDNYTLSGETKSYTISKATPTITLSATSGSVVKGRKLTFTEKANVAGKFTNASGTTSVATVSPASNSTAVTANTAQTVTVTGVANGSSIITVKFVPTDTTNYNNAVAKTYTATILKSATIPTNSLCVARTYNGSDQQITSATSGTGYTLSGYTQKTAGSHAITATLTSGYRWSDNTTGKKTFSCSISKATPTVTIGSSTWFNSTAYVSQKASVAGTFEDAISDKTTNIVEIVSNSSISVNANAVAMMVLKPNGTGTKKINIKFTPKDTTNYNIVTRTFTAKSDKTSPVIALNGRASSTSINNGSGNITIPIKITESHSGITSSDFTANDITVKIGTTTVTPAVKSLKYNSVSNGVYSYTLTLKIGDKNVGGTVNLSIAASAIKDNAGNGNKATTLNTGVTYTTAYPTLGATATCTKTSTGYRAQISCHNCKELYYVYYNSPYPASTAALATDAKNAGTYTSRSSAGDLSKTSTYTTSSTYSRLYYGASNDKGNSVLKYVTCGS